MEMTTAVAAQSKAPALSSAALYREHAQRVAGWASRLGGPRRGADLEDVVQEVFLRVHRALPGFRGEAEVTTWLYRITENVVRARLRKERLRRFFGFDGGSSEKAEREVPSPRLTPEGDFERSERARLLYDALDRIPESYRNPFILFEIEGLPGEEVARLVGVKLPTLWVRLSRAREQVANELHGRSKKSARRIRELAAPKPAEERGEL
jgi:RNA polymerase sigma-70 factor (ECF subfamily)